MTKKNEKDMVRMRKSYRSFKEIYARLNAYGVFDFKVLRMFHEALDNKMAYKSRTASEFAEESLNLFIKDMQDGKN